MKAGVNIACTASSAARSSRSRRNRRASINPKTTAASTVSAVAMLAIVERSTVAFYKSGRGQFEKETKKPQIQKESAAFGSRTTFA